MDLTNEWLNFFSNDNNNDNNNVIKKTNNDIFDPKCSNIYISTKSKIIHLNKEINLYELFWKIPIIDYSNKEEGIIKKQIKFKHLDKESLEIFLERLEILKRNHYVNEEIIKQIHTPIKSIIFRDERKISVGLSFEDFINKKVKKRAFDNCIVFIIRILINKDYREFHLKLFNTGKIEIPGLKTDYEMNTILDILKSNLQKIFPNYNFKYNDFIDTILINSNFTCNFNIERNILTNILLKDYELNVAFDPCSYPAIQCKFFYNENKKNQNGICECETPCNLQEKKVLKKCREVSIMIFRTGSILIVGHINENMLTVIYNFIKNILLKEFEKIKIDKNMNFNENYKKTKKKINKIKILECNL